MTDDLRTRIAAVLYQMDCDDYDIQAGEELDPSVFWAIREGAERRADAVIRELNLQPETMHNPNGAILTRLDGKVLADNRFQRRWVTPWECDESPVR